LRDPVPEAAFAAGSLAGEAPACLEAQQPVIRRAPVAGCEAGATALVQRPCSQKVVGREVRRSRIPVPGVVGVELLDLLGGQRPGAVLICSGRAARLEKEKEHQARDREQLFHLDLWLAADRARTRSIRIV